MADASVKYVPCEPNFDSMRATFLDELATLERGIKYMSKDAVLSVHGFLYAANMAHMCSVSVEQIYETRAIVAETVGKLADKLLDGWADDDDFYEDDSYYEDGDE